MVKVTEAAAEQIKILIAGDTDAENIIGIRLAVKAGGCAGMMYDMKLLTEPLENDKQFVEHGITLYMDPKSYLFLGNITVDYEKGMMTQGFVFINPQATGGCGCGQSFS